MYKLLSKFWLLNGGVVLGGLTGGTLAALTTPLFGGGWNLRRSLILTILGIGVGGGIGGLLQSDDKKSSPGFWSYITPTTAASGIGSAIGAPVAGVAGYKISKALLRDLGKPKGGRGIIPWLIGAGSAIVGSATGSSIGHAWKDE